MPRRPLLYVGNHVIVCLGVSLLLPEFAFTGVTELSTAPSFDLMVQAALLRARLVYVAVAVHVVDS